LQLTSTLPDIEKIEKRTFLLHIFSQVFSGIALGIGLLQDVILKKSLDGSDSQILLLAFLVSTAFLVSIYGAEIVNRSQNRSAAIIKMGFIGKASLLILPLFDSPVFFIACISISAYFDSMLLSSWNIVYKHNYREEKRSRLFSYASAVQTILILSTSTVFGYFMDKNESLYKICFPAAGILGMLTYYNLAKMISLSMDDYKSPAEKTGSQYSFKLLKDIISLPMRNIARIFKENKDFMRFEIYFFLYGMAFMVIIPALPIYLVDYIKMDYSQISLARGLIFHSALILFTPFMGRHHGHGNPARFCGIVFLILVLYPLFLILANHTGVFSLPLGGAVIVYIAAFAFGIGMSGISIAWALSSIYYAPKYRESNYQAVHITLTGIRGFFSPALGYAVMKIFSIEYTFTLSALLFLTGGLLMLREYRIKNVPEPQPRNARKDGGI
jgi:Major Facilitator Superfamily